MKTNLRRQQKCKTKVRLQTNIGVKSRQWRVGTTYSTSYEAENAALIHKRTTKLHKRNVNKVGRAI